MRTQIFAVSALKKLAITFVIFAVTAVIVFEISVGIFAIVAIRREMMPVHEVESESLAIQERIREDPERVFTSAD